MKRDKKTIRAVDYFIFAGLLYLLYTVLCLVGIFFINEIATGENALGVGILAAFTMLGGFFVVNCHLTVFLFLKVRKFLPIYIFMAVLTLTTFLIFPIWGMWIADLTANALILGIGTFAVRYSKWLSEKDGKKEDHQLTESPAPDTANTEQ